MMKNNYKPSFLITIALTVFLFSSACTAPVKQKTSENQTKQETKASNIHSPPLPKKKLAYHEARKLCLLSAKKKNEYIKHCIKRVIKESTINQSL